MARKRIDWKDEDVFVIPLLDNRFTIGHVLDRQMKNVVRIALYNESFDSINLIDVRNTCKDENLISLLACTIEQLDFNVWKIIGNKKSNIPISKYPNEAFRNNGWIGSKMKDAALVEDFVNAFYGLGVWDNWADPLMFDKYLVDISKKPKNILLKSRSE